MTRKLDRKMIFLDEYVFTRVVVYILSVLHQVSIVTKYDVKINGIKLNDRAISIDDYSSDDRIVHVIIYKQDLSNIVKQQEDSKPEMNFTLSRPVILLASIASVTIFYRLKFQVG
ncbi:MAG TPA: hypothetical protein VFA69_03270 [Candidatus Nitrosotalea sp.]|nr:hypothetical protein [Candidatus Nitrosotalea sp.]